MIFWIGIVVFAIGCFLTGFSAGAGAERWLQSKEARTVVKVNTGRASQDLPDGTTAVFPDIGEEYSS